MWASCSVDGLGLVEFIFFELCLCKLLLCFEFLGVKGVLYPWTLFWKTLCILSKIKQLW